MACPTSSATRTAFPSDPDERGELGAGGLRRVGIVQIRDLDERLGQRVERDAFPVREAPATEDGRAIAELVDERGHEPRLPHAPNAEDREELTRLIAHGPVECTSKERELAIPADHRRVEVSGEPGRPRGHLDEAERGHRIGLSLRVQRVDRLDDDRVANERERVFPQQDLARAGQPAPGVPRR